MSEPAIYNDTSASRYALEVEGGTALVAYNLSPPNLMVTETLVPVASEGRGIASRLAAFVIADARARGLLILPTCPFFSDYLRKHPENADVVHPTYRQILGL